MSSGDPHLTAIREAIRTAVDDGIWPAAQFAVARHGELMAFEAFGDATENDRFCLFSATKPVVASLVWQLLGEGLLDLDTRVSDLWPEFGAHGKEAVTVEQVLLHTSGFPNAAIDRDRIATHEGRAGQMAEWRLEWEPGTRYEYHPLSAHWVLAEAVHRVTGQDFRQALRTRVLDPLGLDRLELGVPAERQGDLKRVAITGKPSLAVIEALFGMPLDEAQLDAGLAAGLVFANEPEVIAAGVPGAGAFSDAADVVLFYQALLRNEPQVWRPDVLAMATGRIRNTFPDTLRAGASANRTIGLVVAGPDDDAVLEIGETGITVPARAFGGHVAAFGGHVSERAFGHGGAGGQSAWADPDSGLSFCLLTNGMTRDVLRDFDLHQTIESHVPALA